MRQPTVETITTEILSLGSRGAGLLAALHAHDANPRASIFITVKGLLGKSGCTRMVQGGYNAVLHPTDSLDNHFRDTIEGGAYLSGRPCQGHIAGHWGGADDVQNHGSISGKDHRWPSHGLPHWRPLRGHGNGAIPPNRPAGGRFSHERDGVGGRPAWRGGTFVQWPYGAFHGAVRPHSPRALDAGCRLAQLLS